MYKRQPPRVRPRASDSRWPKVGKAGGGSEEAKNGEGTELPHARAKQLFSKIFLPSVTTLLWQLTKKMTTKVNEAVGGATRKPGGGKLSHFHFFTFLERIFEYIIFLFKYYQDACHK